MTAGVTVVGWVGIVGGWDGRAGGVPRRRPIEVVSGGSRQRWVGWSGVAAVGGDETATAMGTMAATGLGAMRTRWTVGATAVMTAVMTAVSTGLAVGFGERLVFFESPRRAFDVDDDRPVE
ncbi:MAG: hypothetical protein QOE57_346 [Acidimicrobiaceae bacterium]|nr:hypothetical protein [Acidimicrobiaceae bacterium]